MNEYTKAPQDARDALDKYVTQVLEALGHPEAFVTDESMIKDFLHWSKDPALVRENEARLTAMSEALRVPVEARDYVVDVARRIKALGST